VEDSQGGAKMEKVQHSKLITFPEKREEFEKIIGFDYIRAQLSPKTPFGKKVLSAHSISER